MLLYTSLVPCNFNVLFYVPGYRCLYNQTRIPSTLYNIILHPQDSYLMSSNTS